MKPYVLIKGSDSDLGSFEDKIGEALSQGFEFSSELITQVVNTAGKNEVILFQPMVIAEEMEDYDDDMDEEEEIDFDEELLVEED